MNAGIEDLNALVELEGLCFPDAWSENSLSQILADERYLVLLHHSDAGKPLGYLIGSSLLNEAELARIAVIPQERGRGLGRKLLSAALQNWRESGVESVFLEVRAFNRAAISIYESCGFATIATRKRYYDDGEDALVMRLELSPAIDD